MRHSDKEFEGNEIKAYEWLTMANFHGQIKTIFKHVSNKAS